MVNPNKLLIRFMICASGLAGSMALNCHSVSAADIPIQLKIKAEPGLVLSYRTVTSGNQVEARVPAQNELGWKDFKVPSHAVAEWQVVVCSRDEGGNLRVAVPVKMNKNIKADDLRKIVPGISEKAREEGANTSRAGLYMLTVSPEGVVRDASIFNRAFYWLLGCGLYHTSHLFLLPFPQSGVRIGESWGPWKGQQDGDLLVTATLVALESVDGEECVRIDYSLTSPPDSTAEVIGSTVSVWFSRDMCIPVKIVTDISTRHKIDPTTVESFSAETNLVSKSQLNSSQRQAVLQAVKDIDEGNAQLRRVYLQGYGNKELQSAGLSAAIESFEAASRAPSLGQLWREAALGMMRFCKQERSKFEDASDKE